MKKILACLLALVVLCTLSSALAMTAAGGLTYGDRGEEVLKVQQALDKLGYKVGKLDGSFGAYTENALRKFQKKYGLAVLRPRQEVDDGKEEKEENQPAK